MPFPFLLLLPALVAHAFLLRWWIRRSVLLGVRREMILRLAEKLRLANRTLDLGKDA